MGDWIFQAILSMLCGALFALFFAKKCIAPPNTSVFELQKISIEESYNESILKK